MKNIFIRDEVYEKLLKLKRGKESFSDVIMRLIEGRTEVDVLEKYAGKLSESELSDLVSEERKKLRVRDFDN
ncbi:MAG: antitoxin [Archaeoglobales archaeon]|jgi:predicted CopG family antitoxin|nr:antitoxin [Archaeoglobi archaeon]NHW22789.1 antitoxin [Archaeoglobales archaeon]TDA30747.1 MAG: antitoxin [Archaeoglobi archaeon]